MVVILVGCCVWEAFANQDLENVSSGVHGVVGKVRSILISPSQDQVTPYQL